MRYVAILSHSPSDGRAVQDDERDDDAPWVPSQLPGDGRRFALVERDASLYGTQIVDLGLRFLDQERTVCVPEREEVDPAAGWAAANRDLGPRDPAGPFKPAREVASQPGMHGVVLTSPIAEVACIELKRHPDTERVQHPFDRSEIEMVARSAFDAPHRGVGRPRPSRQIALGPSDQASSLANHVGKLRGEPTPMQLECRVRHRPLIALPSSFPLIGRRQLLTTAQVCANQGSPERGPDARSWVSGAAVRRRCVTGTYRCQTGGPRPWAPGSAPGSRREDGRSWLGHVPPGGAPSVARTQDRAFHARPCGDGARLAHIGVNRGHAARTHRGVRSKPRRVAAPRETRLQPTRRGGTIQSPRGTGTGLDVSRTPTRRHPRSRRGKGGLPGGRVARRARGERRAPGGRR